VIGYSAAKEQRGGSTMRITLFAAALLIASPQAGAAPASGTLPPKDIQTTFFNGTPFTAAATGAVKYKMTFTADGKMTREPLGSNGSKAEGTWKLSNEGFCSTWKGSKANCFRVAPAGDNQWSILKGTTKVATWSKQP
jgi:hypothetical protein